MSSSAREPIGVIGTGYVGLVTAAGFAELGAETAYVEPEILKIEPAVIERFVAQEHRLKIYRVYLDDIQRRRAHGRAASRAWCVRRSRCVRTR